MESDRMFDEQFWIEFAEHVQGSECGGQSFRRIISIWMFPGMQYFNHILIILFILFYSFTTLQHNWKYTWQTELHKWINAMLG